jgi:hypothetical protein
MWARGHVALIVAVVLCASVSLWLLEHDARRKQDWELQQLRRETSAEVTALRAQAAKAMAEFRSQARLIRDLEARRASLEREAVALRRRLNSLRPQAGADLPIRSGQVPAGATFPREEEHLRARPAETLGQPHVSGRVRAQRGPEDFGNRESAIGNRRAGLGNRESGPGEETGNWKLETGNSKLEDRKPGAAADEIGSDSPASSIQFPVSSFADAIPDSRLPTPALAACREQSAVQEALIANCEQRVEASQAVIDAMNRSIEDLQQMARANDAISQRRDTQHRAELKAARGSRLRRLGRAMQYVGAGVVLGVVVAR